MVQITVKKLERDQTNKRKVFLRGETWFKDYGAKVALRGEGPCTGGKRTDLNAGGRVSVNFQRPFPLLLFCYVPSLFVSLGPDHSVWQAAGSCRRRERVGRREEVIDLGDSETKRERSKQKGEGLKLSCIKCFELSVGATCLTLWKNTNKITGAFKLGHQHFFFFFIYAVHEVLKWSFRCKNTAKNTGNSSRLKMRPSFSLPVGVIGQ